MIVPCNFEQSVTGMDIYRVEFPADLSKLRAAVSACNGHIITKIDSINTEGLNLLLSLGFKYSVGSIGLVSRCIKKKVSLPASRHIHPLKQQDMGGLYEICDEAFSKNNRYANDPILGPFNREIHREWIANSICGYADYCYGFWDGNDGLVGFTTLHLDRDHSRIGLLAVKRGNRRGKVATHLVRHLMSVSGDKGKKQVCVATESINFPALNFYIQLGFQIRHSDLSLYRLPQ